MSWGRAGAATVVCFLAFACGGDDLGAARVPDIEGEVTQVGPSTLTIAGLENMELSPEVQIYIAQSKEALSINQLRGRYVHAGRSDEGVVEWVSSIGLVAGGRTVYVGKFDRIAAERLIMQDDTTFALPNGFEAPAKGTDLLVEIDTATREASISVKS